MRNSGVIARAGALFGVITAVACMSSAQAALVVSGDTSGSPGETITLHIGLDAPLVTDFDQFELTVAFDPAALDALSAVKGALPAGSSFAANPDGGLALISFGSTMSGYPAGELATWTFTVLPGAPRFEPTLVSAALVPSLIDGPAVAPLQSNDFAVTAIPEPSSAMLMAAGLGVFGALVRRRIGTCHRNRARSGAMRVNERG